MVLTCSLFRFDPSHTLIIKLNLQDLFQYRVGLTPSVLHCSLCFISIESRETPLLKKLFFFDVLGGGGYR